MALLMAGCAASADEPADEESALADETARRCAADDPTSNEEILAMASESSIVADCASDDGECQASSECARGPEARDCDTSRLIGPLAARCIARANDLPTGIAGHEVGLVYNFGERRIVWNVTTTLGGDVHSGIRGEALRIDALTGEVLGRFNTLAIQ